MMEELKNRIYELEGLVELASMRPEKRETIMPLIRGKVEEIRNEIERGGEREEEIEREEVRDERVEEIEREEEIVGGEEIEREDKREEGKDRKFGFCLNDRFRFARVLTGGDRERFDTLMKEAAAMPDFEEAVAFLCDYCGLDPESEDGAALLEIMAKFYS